jgi:multiple antibiotic resistance protein
MAIQRLIVKPQNRLAGPKRTRRKAALAGPIDPEIPARYPGSMPLDYLVSALVTLLVVVDPVGLAPTFLAITHGLPAVVRKRIAVRACLIAGAILMGTALIGDWLLRQLGISVRAFRIAGGLLLFAVASEMVLGVRIGRQSKQAEDALEEHVRNIAAFPLAIPLMAGPGAITATLLLAGQAGGQPVTLAVLLSMIVVVMTACLLVFLLANRIERFLGVTGNVVLSRLLGVILAALAVQYVIDGVRTALAA